ncbi:DUF1697 domain-containing protein [Enterococcus hailinensis]|uniref:DUF1697 domain-containing protein n=1 Tax=Enterococcus hailinensis TaxID=3238988 RepID=UPI0038B231C4
MNYIALFRGINVGGKNRVKMADLKEIFNGLGCQDVVSYIQSGNLIFSTDEAIEVLAAKVAVCFMQRFGFETTVVYLTKEKFLQVIEDLPFSATEILHTEEKNPKVAHLYVGFSAEQITSASLLMESERAVVAGKQVYFLMDDSLHFSKIVPKIAKDSKSMTLRNWKTVLKLADLLEK